MKWTEKQAEVAAALIEHRRVMVKASHAVGKTHLAAGLANFFFDCYDPGLTLTTAPTHQQVVDVLWKEIRLQRRGRPGLQPKAPRMETSAAHFAVGFTAASGDAFQGRHEAAVLGIFDEATGVDGAFWDAMEGMMTGPLALWLCIFNPTDTTSRAYEEETSGRWHSVTISGLDHPNIAAELTGQSPPFPAAVRLAWIESRLAEWCARIEAGDRRAGDIEFPPGSGIWYRPGPLFESRVLGRWPTAGGTSVWSEASWDAALVQQPIPEAPLEIGCDVARYGDDFTSILARRGPCALHHETHNGWSTAQTAGCLKRLAGQLAQEAEDPKRVAVKVDDTGVGGGVVDQADGYRFIGVNAGAKAFEPEGYPNMRSEMWFVVADRADRGELDLSRLPGLTRRLLRTQLLAPKWRLDSAGRRVVEPKDDTKRRVGRSPDDADALNMAYALGEKPKRIIRAH